MKSLFQLCFHRQHIFNLKYAIMQKNKITLFFNESRIIEVIRAWCRSLFFLGHFIMKNCLQSFLFNGTFKSIRPGINFTDFFFFFPLSWVCTQTHTHTDWQYRSYRPYSSTVNLNGMARWIPLHSFELRLALRFTRQWVASGRADKRRN